MKYSLHIHEKSTRGIDIGWTAVPARSVWVSCDLLADYLSRLPLETSWSKSMVTTPTRSSKSCGDGGYFSRTKSGMRSATFPQRCDTAVSIYRKVDLIPIRPEDMGL